MSKIATYFKHKVLQVSVIHYSVFHFLFIDRAWISSVQRFLAFWFLPQQNFTLEFHGICKISLLILIIFVLFAFLFSHVCFQWRTVGQLSICYTSKWEIFTMFMEMLIMEQNCTWMSIFASNSIILISFLYKLCETLWYHAHNTVLRYYVGWYWKCKKMFLRFILFIWEVKWGGQCCGVNLSVSK